MITVRSLRRDTRFKQAKKLQSWMVILIFKTCKVWFFLNSSMCYSGFSRIPGSSVTNFPWVFSSLQNFINSSLTPQFSALLRNPSPLFIVIFWSPRGTIGSPVLSSSQQGMYCAHRSAGFVSLFFILSFLYLFSQTGGISFCRFESLPLLFPFYTSSFWFP